jgi:hypothetical protein
MAGYIGKEISNVFFDIFSHLMIGVIINVDDRDM